MTRAVSINKEYPGYSNPGFFRLKNNACLVLTEPGGVQEETCILGVGCVTLRDDTIRPIRKEPQIHSPPAELSACYARGRAGNTDEHRCDYNNSINIFQPEHPTRIHPPNPGRHAHDRTL